MYRFFFFVTFIIGVLCIWLSGIGFRKAIYLTSFKFLVTGCVAFVLAIFFALKGKINLYKKDKRCDDCMHRKVCWKVREGNLKRMKKCVYFVDQHRSHFNP